jgi:outer membrane receptor for ferrienterochelin and colicins
VLYFAPFADLELETIVVTGTRSNHMVRDEPVKVEVVPEEEIEENLTVQPGNLSSLLAELPGVHIQSTAPGLGGATLSMRGMPGRHTLILQDGLPLLGAQTGGFGLLQTPPLDLQRVEVIKGVGSALYGGAGLGGVLNLASRLPDGESEILLNRSSHGATDAVGFFASELSPTLGYTVSAGAHDQTQKDLDGDAWADLAGYRRYTIRPRVFWNDGAGRSLFATLGLLDESRLGGTFARKTLADGQPFLDALQTRRIDGGLVAKSALRNDRQLETRWSMTRQTQDRNFGRQHVQDAQLSTHGEATIARSTLHNKWLLGIAMQFEQLRSSNAPDAEYRYVVPALLLQDDFTVNDSVSMVASARVDHHNVFGTFFSPRLSILNRPRAGWTIRASFGNGFSAPTPLIEETEATTLAVLSPLRNLSAEHATSGSLDIQWTNHRWELDASAFASTIRDVLSVRAAVTPGKLDLINSKGPQRAVGAEVLARYVNGAFHLIGNCTILKVTESGVDGARLKSELQPSFSGELAALFEDEDRGRIGLEVSYTGKQSLFDNPYRPTSKPYVELSALAELKLGEAAIFFNAINLTNVRQTHFDPLLLPAPAADGGKTTHVWGPLAGRTFNLGIRVEL